MVNAYSKLYLERARLVLAHMLDDLVNDAGYDISYAWYLFISSKYSKRFEDGDSEVLAGMSGAELAFEVAGKKFKVTPRYERTKEFWVGWSLAYYQWFKYLHFVDITSKVPIDKIVELYDPYHEMDIVHFCEIMDKLIGFEGITNLKRIRNKMKITQRELSSLSGVPIRTIQQYEQKQKNINNARAEYVIKLAKALYCEPHEILENNYDK